MPKLLISYGKTQTEQEFSTYVTIGRSSHCHVSIKDIKLSRIHCEIIRDDDDFVLVDLHSQNGTKVNGILVPEAILKKGDIISIGRAVVIFTM